MVLAGRGSSTSNNSSRSRGSPALQIAVYSDLGKRKRQAANSLTSHQLATPGPVLSPTLVCHVLSAMCRVWPRMLLRKSALEGYGLRTVHVLGNQDSSIEVCQISNKLPWTSSHGRVATVRGLGGGPVEFVFVPCCGGPQQQNNWRQGQVRGFSIIIYLNTYQCTAGSRAGWAQQRHSARGWRGTMKKYKHRQEVMSIPVQDARHT